MNHFFVRCAYPWVIVVLAIVIVLVIVVRRYLQKQVVYRYSLGNAIKKIAQQRLISIKKCFMVCDYWY